MREAARQRGLLGESDLRQELGQEIAGAPDVGKGEFRAVDRLVTRPADIAGIVKQRDQNTEHRAPRSQLSAGWLTALMAVDEARQRQCAVETVLRVVIPGVASGVAGESAGEQPGKRIEPTPDRRQVDVRVAPGEDPAHGCADRLRVGNTDRVGHVVIVAARCHVSY